MNLRLFRTFSVPMLALGLLSTEVAAQINPLVDTKGHMGIGTTTPNPAAILDLNSTTAGLLLPRLTQTDIDNLVMPPTGLMVFNTSTNEMNYNFGTAGAPDWQPLLTPVSPILGSLVWKLAGNSVSAGDFLGTTNTQPLVLKTDNVERVRIAADGKVGIGTPTPGEAVDVVGNMQFSGALMPAGSPGTNGQILTSTGTGTPPVWSNAASPAWTLTGNSGTTPGTDFVGTTDAQAFEIHVDETGIATEGRRRVMRYEPNSTSPNIIGGFNGNSVSGGAVGAVIAGGGENGNINSISATQGVIGGGRGNTVTNPWGTIAGGEANRATQTWATVAGGQNDTANGTWASVGGGQGNNASASWTTIAGGHTNQASGAWATVAGGENNQAATASAIGGGQNNQATGFQATVAGGGTNQTNQAGATIGGGQNNTANGFQATIAGGGSNQANGAGAAVGGGQSNTANAFNATVGGGQSNQASNSWSTVGGGQSNQANETWATVSGGQSNINGRTWAAIGGGQSNQITGLGTWSFIGAGQNNQTSGTWSAIAGGQNNQITGSWSAIAGGFNNQADSISAIPGGRYLKLGANSFGFNGDTVAATTTTDLSSPSFRSTAYFGNVDLMVGNVDNNARQLRFYEPNTVFDYSGTNYTSFKAQAQAADVAYTLPDAQGAANTVLVNDGTGLLSWGTNGATIVNNINSTNTGGSAFGANQDDLSLSSTATFFRMETSVGAGIDITGIVAGVNGRQIILCNVGANPLTLKHQDAGSTAANRFELPGASDVTLGQNGIVMLIYDAASGYWRFITSN